MRFLTLVTLFLTGSLLTVANANNSNSTTVYHIKSQSRYLQIQPQGMLCTPVSVQDGKDCKIFEFRRDGRIADTGQMTSLPEPATPAPTQTPQEAEADKLKKERDELIAKEKEARCQTMRTNLAAFSTGGRIYETNDKGERVYLNDQEISSKKQRTADAIAKDCQ